MKIIYKQVQTINEFIDAIRLRADVFIKEQGFQPGWEPDEDDKKSVHYIAICGGKVVSTARHRETAKGEIKIERMATAKDYRGKNIGRGLVVFMIDEIKTLGPKRIWLRSQVQSQKFYEKCGFAAVSKPFDQWGVPHIDMEHA
ncbi:MAG: GNAT family N-acetyltransferase [Candidatus Micrarchaeota archaeon]